MTVPRPREDRVPRPRAAPFRCRLVVMAKVPAAGRAKTRLARGLGTSEATRFARHAAAAVLRRLGAGAPWQITLAVAPDSGVGLFARLRRIDCRPQGGGDLGARMQRIMQRTAPGPVVIAGTDAPGLARGHIREAFRLLGRHDAVVGPAADGGYWLFGLRRRPRVLRPFGRVRWSGPHALSDTLANLQGRSVAMLEVLADVDSAADFRQCSTIAGRTVLPAGRDRRYVAN
jgi:rSAM/selenodomain-associated transferase 1